MYHTCDTTPGNSGSSIMVTDKNFFDKGMLEAGYTKKCIGIHTGSEPLKHLNFATLITQDIMGWIGREVGIYSDEREQGQWK